jgi:regulator of sigma E protease
MDIFVGVIVGLVVLMILVILHEFGHFIAARRNGVNVLEFGIGFPPRAMAWIKDPKTGKWHRLPRSEWKKAQLSKVVYSNGKNANFAQKGMIFSLNWLPIGGFCQMDGESAADKRVGTFGAASFWVKTKILFAGVAMNWLVAAIVFTILAWTGMPDFIDGQFTIESDTRTDFTPVQILMVAENSPAAEAGILPNDYIVAIDDNAVKYGDDITNYNVAHAGETVTYKIYRKGEDGCNCDKNLELNVSLNPSDAEYLLGVTMGSSQTKSYSTWSAPVVGVGLTLQITGQTFKGVGELLWNLISGTGRLLSLDASVRESGQEAISAVGDSVSGPVGIIGVLFPAFTSAGPSNLAYLAAIISISLACMNVLPIPALDGGRWLLIAIYKLRRKELTKKVEEKIVTRAFVALLLIMIIVTILDIVRFF